VCQDKQFRSRWTGRRERERILVLYYYYFIYFKEILFPLYPLIMRTLGRARVQMKDSGSKGENEKNLCKKHHVW
jgi:hypothetical protein